MAPKGCPETSVTNYRYSLRNGPEERSLHPLHDGSLKSRHITCHPLSSLVIFYLPLSSFVSTYHLSSLFIPCHHLSSFIFPCHHLSSLITCHPLSSLVITCHHLPPLSSLVIAYHPLSCEYFKHGIYSPFFFSSNCSLFHNSNVFGFCIIRILYTGCAKIKKNNSAAKRLNYTASYFRKLNSRNSPY